MGSPNEDTKSDDIRTGCDLYGAKLVDIKTPTNMRHGNRPAVETVCYLREHGAAPTANLVEDVFEAVREHYSNAQTMGSSIRWYLDDLPGVAKAGYGEWPHAGDDTVREVLAVEDGPSSGIHDLSEGG